MKKKNQQKKKQSKKRGAKKGFFIFMLIFVILLGAGIYYVLTNLNFIVRKAIEKYGSQATQTEVKVDYVQISLKEGSGVIHDLKIGNPEGFERPNAFFLGEIGTKINLKSITKEVKIIDDITIQAPRIFLEVNADNKNNLNEIKKNLSATTPSKPKAKKASKKEVKLIIRHILFTDGKIHVRIVPLNNKHYQLSLPSFEMRNLGGNSGATPPEISKQILAELTKRALSQVKKKGTDQVVEKIKEKITPQIETGKEKVKDKLKGLLNQ